MKREDFKQIIKLRSGWKIDKRIGDYRLPNGKFLSDYVRKLVESQMELDSLLISKDGNLCLCEGGGWNPETKQFDDYRLLPDFKETEICTDEEMEMRITNLVNEIVQ